MRSKLVQYHILGFCTYFLEQKFFLRILYIFPGFLVLRSSLVFSRFYPEILILSQRKYFRVQKLLKSESVNIFLISQNYFKMGSKFAQIWSKLVQNGSNLVKNRSKLVPSWLKIGSKLVKISSNFALNGLKIGSKLAKNWLKIVKIVSKVV